MIRQLALIPVLVAMLAVHAVRRTYSLFEVEFTGRDAVLTVLALPVVALGLYTAIVFYLVTFS